MAMGRYGFHVDGALFYITFGVVDWLPVFVSEAALADRGLVAIRR